jgi:hypothetical protein
MAAGPPPVSGDAGLLLEFLNDLDAAVLTALAEVDGIVAADVRLALEQLWSDASESRDLLDRELRSVLEGASPDVEDRLRSVGLTGSSLRIKLGLFSQRRDEFDAERATGGLLSRRLRALFKSLLRWANVILGSMVAAIPGGDAYKEAKEAVEAAVEDAEDEDLQ